MKRFFIALFAAGCIAYAPTVLSAEVRLAEPVRGREGEAREIAVTLDTEGETVNGIRGAIAYDARKVHVVAIDDGGSVVNLWIERPRAAENGERGLISFSGIAPGGYEGKNGKLFTLFLEASGTEGSAVNAEPGSVFLHDGKGTERAYKGSSVYVPGGAPASGQISFAGDRTPPEPFTPVLARDPLMFDNRFVLVFGAVDKGSGIKGYEVAEVSPRTSVLAWQDAESPYLLKDQSLRSEAYVRAVDNAGNFRIVKATIEASHTGRSLWTLIVLLAAILVLLYAGWVLKDNAHIS